MAEALLNPWGDDDDDFQISYLIDRNFQVLLLLLLLCCYRVFHRFRQVKFANGGSILRSSQFSATAPAASKK